MISEDFLSQLGNCIHVSDVFQFRNHVIGDAQSPDFVIKNVARTLGLQSKAISNLKT